MKVQAKEIRAVVIWGEQFVCMAAATMAAIKLQQCCEVSLK